MPTQEHRRLVLLAAKKAPLKTAKLLPAHIIVPQGILTKHIQGDGSERLLEVTLGHEVDTANSRTRMSHVLDLDLGLSPGKVAMSIQ